MLFKNLSELVWHAMNALEISSEQGSGRPLATVPILELRQATKKYAGVPAIDSVDFTLRTGEIHAIVGENGAGKSTLTKVMAGVVNLTSGKMLVEGREVNPRTPNEALHLGVAMVFQETSLVPTMTVAQNLFLGQESYFNRLRTSKKFLHIHSRAARTLSSLPLRFFLPLASGSFASSSAAPMAS